MLSLDALLISSTCACFPMQRQAAPRTLLIDASATALSFRPTPLSCSCSHVNISFHRTHLLISSSGNHRVHGCMECVAPSHPPEARPRSALPSLAFACMPFSARFHRIQRKQQLALRHNHRRRCQTLPPLLFTCTQRPSSLPSSSHPAKATAAAPAPPRSAPCSANGNASASTP